LFLVVIVALVVVPGTHGGDVARAGSVAEGKVGGVALK
jgi:hypothetical protein